MEKICSFFGHRTINTTTHLYEIATAEIIRAINNGCHIFYFGGYGDFDSLCHEIVTKIKMHTKQIRVPHPHGAALFCFFMLFVFCKFFEKLFRFAAVVNGSGCEIGIIGAYRNLPPLLFTAAVIYVSIINIITFREYR